MNRLSAMRLLSFQRHLYTHCRSTTIDLRSDTATKPTIAVLEAMIQADVGDAAIGECPATAHLEQRTAALLGKECGLWVPTGTFANLLALTLQSPQGPCLAGASSHLIRNGTGLALGVQLHPLPEDATGAIAAAELQMAARRIGRPAMVSLELSHDFCGGSVPGGKNVEQYLDDVATVCNANQMALHVDGARLLHAAVASGLPAAELVRVADTVAVCFSKGLGAPMGSVLAGSEQLIQQAIMLRKQLGGATRQSGYSCQAGSSGLDNYQECIAADHRRAASFVEQMSNITGVEVIYGGTNIVYLQFANRAAPNLCEELKQKGILCKLSTNGRVRFVFHRSLSEDDCIRTAQEVSNICAQLFR